MGWCREPGRRTKRGPQRADRPAANDGQRGLRPQARKDVRDQEPQPVGVGAVVQAPHVKQFGGLRGSAPRSQLGAVDPIRDDLDRARRQRLEVLRLITGHGQYPPHGASGVRHIPADGGNLQARRQTPGGGPERPGHPLDPPQLRVVAVEHASREPTLGEIGIHVELRGDHDVERRPAGEALQCGLGGSGEKVSTLKGPARKYPQRELQPIARRSVSEGVDLDTRADLPELREVALWDLLRGESEQAHVPAPRMELPEQVPIAHAPAADRWERRLVGEDEDVGRH
jgi:hypothetical protein